MEALADTAVEVWVRVVAFRDVSVPDAVGIAVRAVRLVDQAEVGSLGMAIVLAFGVVVVGGDVAVVGEASLVVEARERMRLGLRLKRGRRCRLDLAGVGLGKWRRRAGELGGGAQLLWLGRS